MSPSTLWGAAKAVIRGKLIMWSAHKKKEKEKKMNDLTAKLKSLENTHMKYNDVDVLKQIQYTKPIKQTNKITYIKVSWKKVH